MRWIPRFTLGQIFLSIVGVAIVMSGVREDPPEVIALGAVVSVFLVLAIVTTDLNN